MRQTLQKTGKYSPEQLDEMATERAQSLIGALPASDGLQWDERKRMVGLGYGETQLRAMSTADAHKILNRDDEGPQASGAAS
jgi:hypothetical protein